MCYNILPTGFSGKTELDGARVDMIVEAVEDMQRPLLKYFYETSEDKRVRLVKICIFIVLKAFRLLGFKKCLLVLV